MSKYTKTARSICDMLLFVALCVSIYLLQRMLPHTKRGFFCGDESLSYPLRESTIDLSLLLSSTLAVPTTVIILVELFKQLQAGRATNAANANGYCMEKTTNSSTCSCGCRMGYRLLQCYKQLGYFLFGLALSIFATQLTKYTIGRPRPHFFAVCQPIMPDGSTCADAHNQGRYIAAYICSNTNSTDFQMKQLNQSFPSGHASLIFYAMTYLVIYLQAVLSKRLSKLLKHLLQFICIMYAWYVALTRITDYWHHWSDVLAGALLGISFAALTAVYVGDIFAYKHYKRGSNNLQSKFTYKTQISPKNSSPKSTTTLSANSNAAMTAALPAYTFGTLPYLPHPAQAQYAQTYHNYGYVP